MSPMELFSICFSWPWSEEEGQAASEGESVKGKQCVLAYFVLCDRNTPWKAIEKAQGKFRADFPGATPDRIDVSTLPGDYLGQA